MERPIDTVFLIFFTLMIPVTVIDSQVLFPKWMYPSPVRAFLDWYTHTFRDPLMVDTPAWLRALFMCEAFLQLPLFFILIKVFWQGVSKFRWIRTPAIICSSHMCTVWFAVLYHIAMADFSNSVHPAPRTSWERFVLSVWYIPFFTVPFMLLIDASCSSVYKEKQKRL